MKAIRNDSLSMSMVLADIHSAECAFEYFKHTNLKANKGTSAYHVQQACEKLIKL